MVQGHPLRWLVAVLMQAGKSYAGWSPLTTPPGDEGARHRVILRLLGDHRLFMPPTQQRQLTNHLPAYPVGSLRAHGQVACLVAGINDLGSSDNPQAKLQRCPPALHEVLACGRSKKPMIQRQ